MRLLTFSLFLSLSIATMLGDSISPEHYSASVAVGETAHLHETVTITNESSAPVDVFLLSDTTGSMGSAIGSVRDGFGDIVSSVSSIAPNAHYAVGEYKDVVDSFAYRTDQALTNDTGSIQTALNGLSAAGGGDTPEANLYGLERAASTTHWRGGSQRFLVWVGDAPGHDPSNGVTQNDAIHALKAAHVRTLAIDVGDLDELGQATAITRATGGDLLAGDYAEAGSIIEAALSASLLNYSSVSLAANNSSGVRVSFSPPVISGSFSRSSNRTFSFEADFTGLLPGTYTFTTDALVDGGTVASQIDQITVGGAPEPATSFLLLAGAIALGITAKRRSA